MKKIFIRGLIASLSLVSLAACQDYDGGFNSSEIKKAEYAKDFEKTFGKVDPNQDWSMASNLQANVTVGNNPSVVIYSEKPGYAGSVVLGLVNGKSAAFNGIKGAEQIYAVVTENGHTLVSGYYDVINGAVTINNQPVAKRSAMTRADGDPTLGVKLFTHVAWDAEPTWDGKSYWVNEWKHEQGYCFISLENGLYYLYHVSATDSTPRKLAFTNSTEDGYETNWSAAMKYEDDGSEAFTTYMGNYIQYVDGVLQFGQYAAKVNIKKSYDAPYYRISDTKTDDATWVIGDCKTLFWEDDACFLEKEDFRSARKQAVYAKYGATVADLQKGVEFTTVKNGQNINIPMMYGATDKHNVFGYYYYHEGQDPRAVNRYVLFDDASPSANIKVNGTPVGGMTLQSQGSYTDDDEVTCVTRRLVYFGEDGKGIDGNGAGTFDFPIGIHIGFFICKDAGSLWSSLNGCSSYESWAYSMPSLNQKYFYDESGLSYLQEAWGYMYGEDTSIPHIYGIPTVAHQIVDNCDGRVKAITWQYGDKILVGFGDNSGDEDLNDFVFWYDGEVKEDEKPKINITTEDKETSWIFACEDLGGTFDYDFNDVVWEVAQKYEDTYTDGVKTGTTYGNIEIRLLAAGGTLPVNLIYNEENLGEVHQKLANQQPTDIYTPVNIAAPKASVSPKVVKTIETDVQMDINTIKECFKIMVSGADGVKYYVETPDANEHESGNATPQMILLPATWEWPIENKCIKDAYPGFTNWVNTSASDWVNKKTSNAWYVKKK